jgi:hypothetical protein
LRRIKKIRKLDHVERELIVFISLGNPSKHLKGLGR